MKYKNIAKFSLGGGTVLTASILGGLKLKNDADFKAKVIHYQKVNRDFTNKAPTHLTNGYYLPKWDDDNNWKEHYENQKISSSKDKKLEEFVKKHPTATSFKNFCYGQAEDEKAYATCGETIGWCVDCVRITKA